MSAIGSWSTTAASNNSSPPDGAPEGMAPSAVNNIIREVMAQVKTWYESAEWINLQYTHTYASGTSFTIASTDVTSIYTVGRRLKAVGSSTGTIYGTITASSFSTNTTVTVAWDSGSLSNETLTVSIGILNPTNPAIPVHVDTYPLVSGSSDRTKKVRFEVDGLTTATTRVITAPDSDTTLPIASQIITLSGPTAARTVTLPDENVTLDHVTDWVTYTPTITGFGTPSNVSFWSRRVGDTLEVRGKFTSGTSTAVEAQVTLGYNGTNANVTSDATKVPSIQLAGTAAYSGATASSFTVLIESNVGYLTFGVQNGSTSGLTKANGSAIASSTFGINFFAAVPISGW